MSENPTVQKVPSEKKNRKEDQKRNGTVRRPEKRNERGRKRLKSGKEELKRNGREHTAGRATGERRTSAGRGRLWGR